MLANGRRGSATEPVRTLAAAGRVIAEDVAADRDYPPFARSARDGFAVRAKDLQGDVPSQLKIVGEVRAGQVFEGRIGAGEAVEIMTGAPLPEGADTVVMVEHTERAGDFVKIGRKAPGENFGPKGSEARAGAVVLEAGRRLGFAEIGLLAMVGRECVQVFRKPRVAIVPTGDEIVEAAERPEPFQIRNSNAWSLAAQVDRAGGARRSCPSHATITSPRAP